MRAYSNIAVLKYWGKLDEQLILPTKSSLSFTLSELWTDTEVEVKEGKGVELYINGKRAGERAHERVNGFLERARKFYAIPSARFIIKSTTNFPLAAGMASSASGFAALSKALNKALDLNLDGAELSRMARLGSGSASRSVHSGIVVWHKGEDHYSSYAETLFDKDYWQDLRVIYVILNSGEKKVKSREGMALSVSTCPFYNFWIDYEERILLPAFLEAIRERDFERFATLTMEASNNMHAVCLATRPPLFYLNDLSRRVVELVNAFNEREVKAAYTFDAGPNPAIFTLKEYMEELLALLPGRKIVSGIA